MSSIVIKFGRSDGSATKVLFPATKEFAIDLANAISFVLFKAHEFKNSECHTTKRVERDGFFVEFNVRHTRTKFGRKPGHKPQQPQ